MRLAFLTSLAVSTLSSSVQSFLFTALTGLCKLDYHCFAEVTSVASCLYNKIICCDVWDPMKRLLSPFHISSWATVICVHYACVTQASFLLLKNSKLLLTSGHCAYYCSLCSGLPPSILSVSVLILQISIYRSSQRGLLWLFFPKVLHSVPTISPCLFPS